MLLSRRRLFTYGAVIAAAGIGAGIAWNRRSSFLTPSFEELVTDPDGVLDLPPGFTYRILEQAGDTMTDGRPVPALPDGMGCFDGGLEHLILMRNHEINNGRAADQALAYDANQGGGVTRVVIDKRTGQRLSSNLILTGTSRNCAGGPSPWGWLSCEETEEPGHGFVFLCDPTAASLHPSHPLPGLGRFKHEAATVDQKTSTIYLSEDHRDGLIYRHVPKDRTTPFSGQLEALKVRGRNRALLSDNQKIGNNFDVEWVPITDPKATTTSTREQGRQLGAAMLSRGEGIWCSGDEVFIASTDGGPESLGQVYRLDIGRKGNIDRLTLIVQSESRGVLDSPDNLVVSPTGHLFIAEDGSAPNLIRVMNKNGRLTPFARNALDDGESEFAGPCFSPDGRWLFVNLQKAGLTLAINGPFA